MNFELTPRQHDLRARARKVARGVLRDARAADRLPDSEQRFLATRAAYERLIGDGFLRTCIPTSAGGDNESLLDTAVVVEELFTENAGVALTLLGTVLGLQPVLSGGTPQQQKRLLTAFLETTGAPLAAFCSTEPGGSANAASPPPGDGVRLSGASFAGASGLVGLMGVALMRSAFEHALHFARTEHRGGAAPIVAHQAVGYALADAKTATEAVRSLSLRACWAVEVGHPGAAELAHHAKVFGSETAVRVITDLMQVVGVDSYDSLDPLGGLLQDALALPIFAGGNLGVRRRALHALLRSPDYDPLTTQPSGRNLT